MKYCIFIIINGIWYKIHWHYILSFLVYKDLFLKEACIAKKYIYDVVFYNYIMVFNVKKKFILNLLNLFKKEFNFKFNYLVDIACSDVNLKLYRFRISYILLSLSYNFWIIINVYLREKDSIKSIDSIFKSSVWSEREVYDLYGIFFLNHIDLRKILLDYGFKGHPLRKDFPISGFYDVYFDDNRKKLVSIKTNLMQQFWIQYSLYSWEASKDK